MTAALDASRGFTMTSPSPSDAIGREAERRSATNYPLSRWYLRPAAGLLAERLARSRIVPNHLTLAGLVVALGTAGCLVARPDYARYCALGVLVAWFLDRADGLLARRQQSATPRGAWLDANIDELVDVSLHLATAIAAAALSASSLPFGLLIAFLAGKYLFMYGLGNEPPPHVAGPRLGRGERTWLRRLYHLPANADVRAHLLLLALVSGCLTAELAVVAAYYNFRWLVRYPLVCRRLNQCTPIA
jgi:phosphatidylglycerophosphate synthase